MTVKEYLESTYDPDDKYQVRPRIRCADGYSISVQGGDEGKYCSPRYKCNFYNKVELGYPSDYDEMIAEYAEDDTYCETVYPYTPIAVVEALISKHGGIDFDAPLNASQLHTPARQGGICDDLIRKWAKEKADE